MDPGFRAKTRGPGVTAVLLACVFEITFRSGSQEGPSWAGGGDHPCKELQDIVKSAVRPRDVYRGGFHPPYGCARAKVTFDPGPRPRTPEIHWLIAISAPRSTPVSNPDRCSE